VIDRASNKVLKAVSERKNMKQNWIFSSLFLLNACSMAPKVVHLDPLPPVADVQFSRPVCIAIGEFTDERKDPAVLGHTYNLGVKTS